MLAAFRDALARSNSPGYNPCYKICCIRKGASKRTYWAVMLQHFRIGAARVQNLKSLYEIFEFAPESLRDLRVGIP